MPKTAIPLITVASVSLLALGACEQVTEPDREPDPPETASDDLDIQPTGTVVEVRMIDVDGEPEEAPVQFEPRLITANVGDTIRFIPSSPDHEPASIATMLPDGAQGFDAEPGEPVSYVVTEPGIYGVQCTPHYAAGSVGVIVVEDAGGNGGATRNLGSARAADHPGRANPEFFEIFEEADERGLLD